MRCTGRSRRPTASPTWRPTRWACSTRWASRGAHVCGASMGGMIAQHLAARHPGRVKSLTLMMTTSGARRLPQPKLKVRRALLSRPDGSDPAAVVAHLQRLLTLIGSPAYPADPERLRQRLQATRAARLAAGGHGAPDRGGGGRRRPLAAAAADPGAHPRHPRRGRPSGAARGRRPRPGGQDAGTPWPTSFPAWATTCRCSCCRASPKASPTTPAGPDGDRSDRPRRRAAPRERSESEQLCQLRRRQAARLRAVRAFGAGAVDQVRHAACRRGPSTARCWP